MTAELILIDLGKVAGHLRTNKKYHRLVDQIERQVGAYSVLQDLRYAQALVDRGSEMMKSREKKPHDAAEAQIVGSVITMAAITYARATHSKAEGRRQVQLTKGLGEELQLAHRRVLKIRNEVLAHAGIGPTSPHHWRRETVVFRMDLRNNSHGLMNPYARANWRGLLFEDLRSLLDILIPRAEAAVKARSNELLDTFMKLNPGNRELDTAIFASPFDPDAFHDGSSAAVADFWRSAAGEESQQLITWTGPILIEVPGGEF